jgi:hypothetical protein
MSDLISTIQETADPNPEVLAKILGRSDRGGGVRDSIFAYKWFFAWLGSIA